MALFLWLLMALVPLCLGKGALRILYGNQPTGGYSPADWMLTGGIICIGLAEVVHLGACIIGWSFSGCIKMFGIAVVICLVMALVIEMITGQRIKKDTLSHKKSHRKKEQERVKKALEPGITGQQRLVYILFGIVVLLQLVYVVSGQGVYMDGDMTLETVNSFLAEDAVYQVNPLTGNPYTTGIPLRLEILCLPTFYAMLCRMFGLSVEVVVLEIVPAFVLLGSYLAYSTVAKKLFPKNAVKRGIFLLMVSLLYVVGDYLQSMDGFGMLHSGYRGVFIRGAVLVPYTFGLLLRKRYKLVVLCILAEACIVWTLYGMGACLLVTVGMLCVCFGMKWYADRKGGEEDSYVGTPE